jgi:hypothetical protein
MIPAIVMVTVVLSAVATLIVVRFYAGRSRNGTVARHRKTPEPEPRPITDLEVSTHPVMLEARLGLLEAQVAALAAEVQA